MNHCPICKTPTPNGVICAKCEADFPGPNDFDVPIPPYQMKWIEPGEFTMGSAKDAAGRDPDEDAYPVKLSKGFWIGATEVSQDLYLAVTKKSPSFFSKPDHPVENVSWNEAIMFCNMLSELHNKEPAYQIPAGGSVIWNKNAEGYRLPTEAEWEYTAKCTNHSTGWGLANSKLSSHPVGQQFSEGISDMAGNVWEWCWDWYGPYPQHAAVDPMGRASGKYKVVKGGSWIDNTRILRAANRAKALPNHKSNTIGLRLVRWGYKSD